MGEVNEVLRKKYYAPPSVICGGNQLRLQVQMRVRRSKRLL